MITFYRLEHFHVRNGYKNSVYIGTFSSLELIEISINRLIDKPGFKDFPRSCFIVQNVVVDDFNWKKGFEYSENGDRMLL